MLVVVNLHEDVFNFLDQFVKQLLLLGPLPVVCGLELVSELLGAWIVHSCISLLKRVFLFQLPLCNCLHLFGSDEVLVICILHVLVNGWWQHYHLFFSVLTISATRYPSDANVRWRYFTTFFARLCILSSKLVSTHVLKVSCAISDIADLNPLVASPPP